MSMFGDLASNERGWPLMHVSDFVAGFSSGKSIVGSDGDNSEGARVLKISAVTSGVFRPTESKPLPRGYVVPEAHLVAEGDLLFSRANTSELVGATALVRHRDGLLALPDKLWKFQWRELSLIDPVFVWKLFSQPGFRRAISDRATGSGGSMKNVTQAAVLGLKTPLPPLFLQREFSKALVAVESAREAHRSSIDGFDELFASVQHRAFRGEL